MMMRTRMGIRMGMIRTIMMMMMMMVPMMMRM